MWVRKKYEKVYMVIVKLLFCLYFVWWRFFIYVINGEIVWIKKKLICFFMIFVKRLFLFKLIVFWLIKKYIRY